jgi:hypothetical protein
LKICTNNKEGFEKMLLQSDQVSAQLKAIDGDATWNASKGGKM